MGKKIDENGFWLIKDNPVSKEGVFPYLGKQISPELESEKIYNVYRPKEELLSEEALESFNGIPFIDDHEMIGDGFTKYDDRPAGGVLMNTNADQGKMVGDIKIFSESIKEDIKNGKKELSLGYKCTYELKKGVWNGIPYDAIQRDIVGNHIAVDQGRMGSDVRVYDRAITMDRLDIEKEIPQESGNPEKSEDNGSNISNNGENQMVDKREAIREVMAIANKPDADFKGGEAEKIDTIAAILEKSEYSKSEDECEKKGLDEEEKSDEKEEVKDEEIKKEEEKKGEDEDKDDEDDKKSESMDSMPRKILQMIARRNEIAKEVEPLIGAFACDSMTDLEVSQYACKKLGLKATAEEAGSVLKGYLAATKKDQKVYGLDSSIKNDFGIDKATENYLKGE